MGESRESMAVDIVGSSMRSATLRRDEAREENEMATEDVVRCAACASAWTVQAWRELPKIATLTPAAVSEYVREWPANVVVEVRACGRCGRHIARRALDRAKCPMP
jgi:hypothetical protein